MRDPMTMPTITPLPSPCALTEDMVKVELPGGSAVLRELGDSSGPDEVVIAEGKSSVVWGLDTEDGTRSDIKREIVVSELDGI